MILIKFSSMSKILQVLVPFWQKQSLKLRPKPAKARSRPTSFGQGYSMLSYDIQLHDSDSPGLDVSSMSIEVFEIVASS